MLFREEGRLSWMYKDKVDDEEFLLGRRIDNATMQEPEPATQGKSHYFYIFCVIFLPGSVAVVLYGYCYSNFICLFVIVFEFGFVALLFAVCMPIRIVIVNIDE